jgi:hypothetical protein
LVVVKKKKAVFHTWCGKRRGVDVVKPLSFAYFNAMSHARRSHNPKVMEGANPIRGQKIKPTTRVGFIFWLSK